MEKETVKKSNKSLFIMIGLIVVVVVAVALFFLINNKDNKKEDTPSNSNSTVNDSNSNSSTNESNSNTNSNDNDNDDDDDATPSEEAEELMKLIPEKDDVSFGVDGVDLKVVPNLYTGKTLKSSDMNLETLLYNTAKNIPVTEKYAGTEDCSNGSIKLDLDTDYKCYKKATMEDLESNTFVIPEEVMKKYLVKFYGNAIQYKALNKFGVTCEEYNYQNGYYFNVPGGCGGVYLDQKNYVTQFKKEETKGNEKYIYLSFIYHVDKSNEKEEVYSTLYKDATLKEKIAENVKKGEDMFEVAKDKAPLYKHTYKKNADGSYYWYSVELVK